MEPSLDDMRETILRAVSLGGDAAATLRQTDRRAIRELVDKDPAALLVLRHPDLWVKWLDKLRAKGYFDDAQLESQGDRMRVAVAHFAASLTRSSSSSGRSEVSASSSDGAAHPTRTSLYSLVDGLDLTNPLI